MLAYLREDVPIHEVFSTELPRAREVVVVLEHIVVAEGLWFKGRTPHHIPVGAVCLLEAGPAEGVDHTVVRVDTLAHLEPYLELVLLHFEDVLFVDWLLDVRHSRRVLEENARRSPHKRTLH